MVYPFLFMRLTISAAFSFINSFLWSEQNIATGMQIALIRDEMRVP